MDLHTLKYEHNVLLLALRQWDDLLPAKERDTHPARKRILEEIKRYEQMIREQEGRADLGQAA